MSNIKQLEINLAKLPDICYGVLATTNEIILIKKGETGYVPTGYAAAKTAKDADNWCNELNSRLDITKAQRKAMELGSMCGWDIPGADPDAQINQMYN